MLMTRVNITIFLLVSFLLMVSALEVDNYDYDGCTASVKLTNCHGDYCFTGQQFKLNLEMTFISQREVKWPKLYVQDENAVQVSNIETNLCKQIKCPLVPQRVYKFNFSLTNEHLKTVEEYWSTAIRVNVTYKSEDCLKIDKHDNEIPICKIECVILSLSQRREYPLVGLRVNRVDDCRRCEPEDLLPEEEESLF